MTRKLRLMAEGKIDKPKSEADGKTCHTCGNKAYIHISKDDQWFCVEHSPVELPPSRTLSERLGDGVTQVQNGLLEISVAALYLNDLDEESAEITRNGVEAMNDELDKIQEISRLLKEIEVSYE